MATSLTSAILTARLRHTYLNGLDERNVTDALDETFTTTLTDGTGANKGQEAVFIQSTLATATPETWDLQAIAGAFGNVNFTKIKLLAIAVTTTTPGYRLEIGGAASNAWEVPVAAAGDIIKAYAGGLFIWTSPVDGGTVDGTHSDLKINNPSGGSVTYQMWIVGEGALA